ncbi:hypothetical protein C8R46DRAFT_1081582 [Mycena filopes]|nr:hypothetical protein C8R46DRAFT_1081582 [Mycena filopes]
MYVAPAAHALYGCTRVADGGDATWTPWRVVGWEPTPEVPLGSGSGTGTPKHGREVKLTDPGLLRHPYFPAQVMWMHNACFGWYALKTVNNLGREAHMRELLKGWKDAGQAARVLVAHTLKKAAEKLAAAAERKGKGRERKRGVKRRASALEDEDEGEDHGDGEGQRYGDDEEEEKPRVKKQQQNRASNPTGLVLQIPAPTTTTTPPVAAPRSVNDWDAYYARPRANSTRTTKELRDQAAVIARLEAENAALKGELEAQGAAVEQHKKENEALREVMPRQEEGRGASPNTGTHDKVAGQERMPFHPEFLDFMRTTFASEVMKGCNSRTFSSLETCLQTKCRRRASTERIAAESAATDGKAPSPALERTDTVYCSQARSRRPPVQARRGVYVLKRLLAELTRRAVNATMDIDGGGDNIDKPSAAETKTIAQVVAARLKGAFCFPSSPSEMRALTIARRPARLRPPHGAAHRRAACRRDDHLRVGGQDQGA